MLVGWRGSRLRGLMAALRVALWMCDDCCAPTLLGAAMDAAVIRSMEDDLTAGLLRPGCHQEQGTWQGIRSSLSSLTTSLCTITQMRHFHPLQLPRTHSTTGNDVNQPITNFFDIPNSLDVCSRTRSSCGFSFAAGKPQTATASKCTNSV